MSIPVAIEDLEAKLAEFGPGYLMTVSPEGRIKVVTVEPTVTEGILLVTDPGRGTLANLVGQATATLAFPPPEPRGHTLLVDGTAVPAGRDVRLTPTGAVLHRPASHSDESADPDGCGHDCRPVT